MATARRATTREPAVRSADTVSAVSPAGPPDPVGLAVDRVESWLVDALPWLRPPIVAELVAGGRSNLTYAIRDAAGQRVALRRPPVAHVLPTAHDVVREFRVLSALAPTDVPTPGPLACCEDEGVTGAPFYVMRFVDGAVLRSPEEAASVLDEPARRNAGHALAATLARIHAVDLESTGLAGLSRHDGYAARQLRRWSAQLAESERLLGASEPMIGAAHQLLEAHLPVQHETTLVHGDYRLDNVVLGPDGEVRAVLDWEICALGDPMADVGLLEVYWAEPGDDERALEEAPTLAPGFPTRQEVVAAYAAASGRDCSNLDFFVAFGYWKLACILQGVRARYEGGAAAGDRSGQDRFQDRVRWLAARALDAARGL